MFSLIITIISIALVTALALATIYYGGSAFRQGGDAAKAAQLINEGQQLAGAVTVTEANSVAFSDQGSLVSANALASTIASYAASPASAGSPSVRAFETAATVSDAVCQKVNDKATGSSNSASVATAAAVSTTYGCYGATAVSSGTAASTSATTGKVVFKF